MFFFSFSNVSLQVELFAKIFTLIGRDLSGSARLAELMHHLRDAFLWSQCFQNGDLSRQKLLHLIELQSGDWQLSPDAVTYYFPVADIKTPKKSHLVLAH